MVQVDISQLSAECNAWREQLRHLRDEFNTNEVKLRQVAGLSLTKDQLLVVERLHNQFHIQLINIHDLKQSIKAHDRKINFERSAFNGNANEDSLQRHEELQHELVNLKNTLQVLQADFNDFLGQVPG
jgi:hypothetical protein